MASDKVTTHGKFDEVAKLTQELKDKTIVLDTPDDIDPTSREALDQICTRIARIVLGDENHPKHWADIAGFAMAKLETLKRQAEKPLGSIDHVGTEELERSIRKMALEVSPQRNGSAT